MSDSRAEGHIKHNLPWTLLICCLAQTVAADGIEFEGDIEIGVETLMFPTDSDTDVRDVFLSIELDATAPLGTIAFGFASLALESVSDTEIDRAFDDLGLYVSELGFGFNVGATILRFRKISPAFGVA